MLSRSSSPTLPSSYEYFWGTTCPQCAVVAEFLEIWEGKDKILMEKYEVNESKANRDKFVERGRFCNIPLNQLGVPLLVTPEGKCFLGDEPIINFFKELNF